MKKLFLFIFTCLILIPVFSQETHKLEIGTGVESLFLTGYYDPDGELVETSGDPACYMFFVSVAYEFFPGFKAGFKPRYEIRNEDAGDVSGFIHHILLVQYTFEFGLGAYVEALLPLGVEEDICGTHPELYLDIALFYDNEFENFTIYGEIVYYLTFEGEDKSKKDQLSVKIQPGYILMDMVEITIAARFLTFLESVYDGEPVENSSNYVFYLIPGVSYKAFDFLTLSIEAPFSLFGASSEAYMTDAQATWGINFNVLLQLL